MTEAAWLACADPIPMLRHLRAKPNDRKALLLTCACIRISSSRDRDALGPWVALARQVAGGERPAADLEQLEVEHGLGEGIDGWALSFVFEAAWQPGSGQWDSAWAKKERPQEVAEQAAQAALVREVFGNPFRPAVIRKRWRTPEVVALAESIYRGGRFRRLPELADALQAAGCGTAAVLDHCRAGAKHVRGCWAVDLVLGRA